MDINFSHSNSISSTGLGLGNGTIDAQLFLSSVDSSLGLTGHRVQVHSVTDYVPLPSPAFHPLGEVTQLVTTSRFLSLEFGLSSGLGSNRWIFPTLPDHNQFMNMNLLRSVNPSMNGIDVGSDVERETRGLGYDGTTHCLPGYPEGVYRCSKCFSTFYSSQTFSAHVRCAHYRLEGEEEGRRRMAARCRRKRNLGHGLTVVPMSSRGIAKGYAARRNNGVAVGVDNGNEVLVGVRAPLLSVVIKRTYVVVGAILTT